MEQHPVLSLLPVLFFYEGALNYNQDDYLQSIISFEHSLKAFHPAAERDNYDFSTGNVYISLGLSYSLVNDWENAQLNYQKAIRENEKAKDSSGIVLAYLNIAYIFYDANDWLNASVSFKRGTDYLNVKTR